MGEIMPGNNEGLINLLTIAAGIAVIAWLVSLSNRKRKFEGDIRSYMSRGSQPAGPEPRSMNDVSIDRGLPLDQPGKFKVVGVHRQTKMDTVDYIQAATAANARAKAELDGIIVTSVSRVE